MNHHTASAHGTRFEGQASSRGSSALPSATRATAFAAAVVAAVALVAYVASQASVGVTTAAEDGPGAHPSPAEVAQPAPALYLAP